MHKDINYEHYKGTHDVTSSIVSLIANGIMTIAEIGHEFALTEVVDRCYTFI